MEIELNVIRKIVKQYEKCPNCDDTDADNMTFEIKDRKVLVKCDCGFFAEYDKDGTEMAYGNVDELGGVHDQGLGWNPYGVYCGECSFNSCVKCPNNTVGRSLRSI